MHNDNDIIVITDKSQPYSTSGQFFSLHPVFSTEDFHNLVKGSKRATRASLLHYFVRRKRIRPIQRGLYAVVPPGRDPDHFTPNRYLVAAALRADTVLCYHTALEVLGQAHNTATTLYGFTAEAPCNATWFQYKFRLFRYPKGLGQAASHDAGLVRREIENTDVRVTGPERLLADCLNCPEYAGGVEEAVVSLWGFPLFDFGILETYLHRLDLGRVFAAVGAFLEQDSQRLFVPDELLGRIERRCPQSKTYLERSQRGGVLLKRWNLIVPRAFLRQENPLEI
jgi:predicted transcriptional regulator of viral defense system